MNITENSTECPQTFFDDFFRDWISNFTLPAVCCVGILGNITAVLVLLSPSMRTTTFHQSLLFLVICDLLYLVMTLSEPRENTPSHELPTAYRLIYPHLWFPLRN